MKISPPGILLLSALAAACTEAHEADPPESGAAIGDSAGVRIVESAEPRNVWRVSAEPLFALGWGADDPTFTWLQSGRILPDGGALAGDSPSGTIYRVGPGGSVEATWGRTGDGPGEYQRFNAILLSGDTVLVSDARLGRITLLSPDGELRGTRLLPTTSWHQVSSVLSDGRLLFVPLEGYGPVDELRNEWVFRTQPILAGSVGGTAVETLVELPHIRQWAGDRGGQPGPVMVKGRAGGFGDGFAWARSDRSEVLWYDGAGVLVQLARWEEEAPPLSEDWRRRTVESYEEASRARGADQASIAAQLRDLEEGFERHGGPLPFWSALHVDRLGNTWLGEYTLPGEPPGRWRVITRDGVFRTWVDLPGVMAILDITEDRILGVRFDQLDVPALVMFELMRE